jgi:hypothetical protein
MIAQHATTRFTQTAAALALTLLLLSGCESKQNAALDQAKQQATATGQPQQVVSTDKNGNTVTTTVQPLQPGQTTQAITTTVTPASAPPANTPATVPGANAANPGASPDQSGQYASQPAQSGQYANQPAQSGQSENQPGNQPGQYANQPAPPPGPGGNPIVRPASFEIAAGTPLVIRINQHISVKHSHVGDRFSGEIEEPVLEQNRVLIPRGAPVEGVIDEAHRRGHFKGSSILELRLVSLSLNGVRYPLDTNDLSRTKKGKGKRSAAFIGGGAGAGMLIGGIATGGVGLLVGGLAGGGAGALAGGLTGNRDIEIPAESIVRFRLAEPLVLQAP